MEAERDFKRYKSAYNELLSLHPAETPENHTLVCELIVDLNEGGVPENYMSCHLLAPNEDVESNGELVEYSMSFIPWIELIDAPVSEESISKYGELLCAAELLWEITFHGFSSKAVTAELQKLDEIAESEDWTPFEAEKYN